MPSKRVYQDTPLVLHQTISLNSFASHYLQRVMRIQLGDCVTVFNGQGGEYLASVIAIKKNNVEVELTEFVACQVESSLHLELGQALLRGDKMDWVIQKAVELGVTAITPILSERINIKLNHDRLKKRMQHWQGVIISACEQSGRCVLPKINSPVSLDDWLQASKIPCFIADPVTTEPLLTQSKLDAARVAIGPEGGFTKEEIMYGKSLGCYSFSMGPRILRTETAAIVALSLVQSNWGDMS